MNRRITVRGIIYQDSKLFAVRHKANETDTKGFWCTPGGGLDDKESLTDGVRRELIEETGVTPIVGRLLFIQQFSKTANLSHEYDEFLEFFFLIDNPDDFKSIDLSSTTHGNQEISQFGFVNPSEVTFLPTFLTEIDLKQYIETVQPVFISNEL